MNFFERQRQVRRLSWRLVALFAVAVVAIVAVVDVIAVFAFDGASMTPASLAALIVTTSIATMAGIGLASLVRTIGLRRGGGAKVARDLGAMYVPEDTTDVQLRRLRNVVEEVAIASGVSVPAVYVLEREAGINAFAAGWSPADAVVAVTRGALERLNRDELQGVIAHEFSHVVNGDMRLNVRLMGLLAGILVLAVAGRLVMYGGGRGRGEKGAPLFLVGLALVVAGYAGVLAGRLIKAAVARQREYLADASAVQFTRQTTGLTGALKKIGGLSAGSNLHRPKAEEVSHMLFGSGAGLSALFATHPPLIKRIQALDPSVDPAELQKLSRLWATAPPSGMQEDAALGLTGRGERLPASGATMKVEPADVVAKVGGPTDAAYHRAEAILDGIPEHLLVRARQPDTVVPLIFGLLLSPDGEGRANQHALLVAYHGQAMADAAVSESDALSQLHPALRLPLAELAFPALRQRPRPEKEAVLASVHALARADAEISVFEYCLSRLMHRELHEAMHHKPPWDTHRRTLTGSLGAAATLLATLAQIGHDDPAAAGRAFAAGLSRIAPQQTLPYAPPTDGVAALEAAWPALDGLRPTDKAMLVESLVAVIGDDGVMTVAEIELLRTICALLHCPLPPLVANT